MVNEGSIKRGLFNTTYFNTYESYEESSQNASSEVDSVFSDNKDNNVLGKKIGFDYVCVSSGGILTKTNLKFKKGFRVNLCKKIKKKTSIITRTSGLIKDIKYANKIIEKGSADLLAIGRSFINDPMLIYKGAKQMKIKNIIEPQYNRMFD